MIPAPVVPLVDGALSLRRATSRVDKIAEMAGVLARHGTCDSETASMRVLLAAGYGQGDIVTLVDAAQRVAARLVQERVTAGMAKP